MAEDELDARDETVEDLVDEEEELELTDGELVIACGDEVSIVNPTIVPKMTTPSINAAAMVLVREMPLL